MNFVNNDDQMTIGSAMLGDIYEKMANDLMSNMITSIKRHGIADLEKEPYLWQLEKLNEMHMLNAQNIALVSKQTGVAEDLLRHIIKNEGLKVYDNTWQQLKETTGLDIPYNGVKATLEAYYNQTFRELDNYINQTLLSTHFGDNAAMRTYQKMLEQVVAEVNVGLKSSDKAIRDVVMDWVNKGIPSEFIDKGGHTWTIDRYARTVVQSTTYRVYNEMRTMASEEFGVDTFYMSAHAAARPMCAPIQGGIVTKAAQGFESGDSKIGYVPSLFDYGWGEPAGTLGINCRHVLTPFVIGVNELPDDPDRPEPSEAIENARQQARQREYERLIKDAEKKLDAAKLLGDKDLMLKYQTRLELLRGGLRDHLAKYEFLSADHGIIKVGKEYTFGDNIKKHLTKDQLKFYTALLNKAPDDVINLFEKYTNDLKLGSTDWNDTAYFSRLTKQVRMNVAEDIQGNHYEHPGSTFFHEFAHNIDYLAGDKSQGLQGIMVDEFKAWSNQIKAAAKKEIENIGVSEFLKKHNLSEWNLNKNKTTLLKSGIDNIVIKELSQLSKYERAELSDWLELAMNRNYPLGFGHGVSYHKSGSKSGIELTSKEIFAEITSAYVASPDSLAVMKKYFPETVNAYDILIKSIVK